VNRRNAGIYFTSLTFPNLDQRASLYKAYNFQTLSSAVSRMEILRRFILFDTFREKLVEDPRIPFYFFSIPGLDGSWGLFVPMYAHWRQIISVCYLLIFPAPHITPLQMFSKESSHTRALSHELCCSFIFRIPLARSYSRISTDALCDLKLPIHCHETRVRCFLFLWLGCHDSTQLLDSLSHHWILQSTKFQPQNNFFHCSY